MKRKIGMSRKIAVIITAASLCLTGCGAEGQSITGVFPFGSDVKGTKCHWQPVYL